METPHLLQPGWLWQPGLIAIWQGCLDGMCLCWRREDGTGTGRWAIRILRSFTNQVTLLPCSKPSTSYLLLLLQTTDSFFWWPAGPSWGSPSSPLTPLWPHWSTFLFLNTWGLCPCHCLYSECSFSALHKVGSSLPSKSPQRSRL